MRRAALLQLIGKAARGAGMPWLLVRQGAGHELWQLDGVRVMIPRHREVNERTAIAILKLLEGKLGERWWES